MNYFYSSSHLRELIRASKVSTTICQTKICQKAGKKESEVVFFSPLPTGGSVILWGKKKVLFLFYDLWVLFIERLSDQTKERVFWGRYCFNEPLESCSVHARATMSESCFLHFVTIVPPLTGTSESIMMKRTCISKEN